MNYIQIALIVLATTVVVVGGIKIGRRVRYKISRVKYFLRNLIMNRGLQTIQNEIIEDTPKSVSGMTKIYLPKILKDFPDFDYGYFRQLTENTIKHIFSSVNNGTLGSFEYAADSFKEQVNLKIKERLDLKNTGKYTNIKIHKTEITNYEKSSGMYTITFQSAFEYVLSGDKIQSRYNVELSYIQDEDKAIELGAEKVLSSVCNNCGAPVKAIQSNCEYCGSLLTKINIRSWKYIRFYEV